LPSWEPSEGARRREGCEVLKEEEGLERAQEGTGFGRRKICERRKKNKRSNGV
jgi:hypothetical protein